MPDRGCSVSNEEEENKNTTMAFMFSLEVTEDYPSFVFLSQNKMKCEH